MKASDQRARFRVAATGLAIVFALGASGCRSAEEEFRVDRLVPLQKAVERQKSAVSQLLSTSRTRNVRDATALTVQIDRLAQVYRRGEELEAPDSVDAEWAEFSRANRGLVRSLEAFVRVLRSGSRDELRAAGDRSLQAAGRAHRADRALEEALVARS